MREMDKEGSGCPQYLAPSADAVVKVVLINQAAFRKSKAYFSLFQSRDTSPVCKPHPYSSFCRCSLGFGYDEFSPTTTQKRKISSFAIQ